jgi:RNA polymerase sigma-70 factor (ECF subfamily)
MRWPRRSPRRSVALKPSGRRIRWVWRTAFRIAAAEMKHGRETEAWPDRLYEVEPDTLALLGALHKLSPKQRASVVLHYHAGYSLKEVASIIGSTPSAVGVHIHRGRKRLRELLGDEDA